MFENFRYVALLPALMLLGASTSGQDLTTGTSVVYIRTRTALWIGADSLNLRLETGKDQHSCKIHQQKDTYFAFAGPEHFGNLFNSIAEARSAIDATSSAKEARDKFTSRMTPRFERAIPAMLKAYPIFFKSFENPNPKEAFFQIVFIEMMNGIVYAEDADFHLKLEKGRKTVFVTNNDCPGNCPEPTSLTPLGRSTAFQPPFDFSKLPQYDPVAAITTLIKLEMKVEPKLVGGNISILKLDASGGHWLIQNPECSGR